MALWNDVDRWSALRSGAACPICLNHEPLHVIATLTGAWLTMPESAPMRGYVCLVSRRHVVELHDLSELEAQAFMRDAQRVSRAVARGTGAVKMNYEIHGNTLPHLHMHFYPRYPADMFEGVPINPKAVTQPVYAPGEFAALREDILKSLIGATQERT